MDALDRRIIAALQIDGRASWRRIASALGENDRTVARRGSRLIESGAVTVTGLWSSGECVIVRLNCRPGTVRETALAAARWPDTVFGYILAGESDCVAEVQCPPERLPEFMLDEVPRLPGLVSRHVTPVLRYFRTVHEWRPGILSPDEVAALERDASPSARSDATGPVTPPQIELSSEESAILRALAEDGRRTHEELAAIAGVSEATARRKVEALTRTGAVVLRASVEPALLGLPVEAMLWIRTRPGDVEEVGELLLDSPLVRYAATVMGEYQLLVHVAQPSKQALHAYLTDSPWVRRAEAVQSHLLVEALKRSATPTRLMRRLTDGPGDGRADDVVVAALRS
ncbi:Lrp/AsnC family transcriptional regulator [Phaeacidiphilus oryzae]|uniref:Lrp/AsnC family transcriptional regulator n=1 Tax=Phaeacidiphilus oryzae TaxID=348818 RepID=UPI0009FBE2CE|nr:Lrp/AsnC family transcriptional regulator [Phaeacidiphilus oryzae]